MNRQFLKQNLANIITCTRMVGTVIMFFTPTFSRGFFIAYTYAGITDAADGFVARKLKITSKFGSKLDSVSDLLFFTLMVIKMIPYLKLVLPKYVWDMILGIVIARVCLYTYVGLTKHVLLSNHTILNKATGFMLFFAPYIMRSAITVKFVIGICILSIISVLYEAKLVIIDRKYLTETKHAKN